MHACILQCPDSRYGLIFRSRVAPTVDNYSGKTSQLCPRALSVLKRQLRLRARLEAAGKIDHDHVFVLKSGKPMQSLQCPQVRWRKTLRSLKLRYRRPYTARHSSVSWNLIGKNALWVAKQHGHSIATMLRAYAAWAEGSVETDIETIKRSMNLTPVPTESSVRPNEECHDSRQQRPGRGESVAINDLAVDLSVANVANRFCAPAFATVGRIRELISLCFRRRNSLLRKLAGVPGFEPGNGGIKTRHDTPYNQQVTDSTDRNIPLQSPRFPIAATKPATSDREKGRRTWPGSRDDQLSSAARKPEAPYGTCRVTPVRPPAGHPERSEVVAESRTSSQQKLIGPPSGDCPWSV